MESEGEEVTAMLVTARKLYLIRVCPYCGRKGQVYYHPDLEYAIVWEGPRRGPEEGLKHDEDYAVSLEDLIGDYFGCGYCPPSQEKK